MRTIRLAFLAAVSTLLACGQADRSPDQDPLREMKDRPLTENPAAQYASADLVGRWQFVLTDEVKSKALARIAATGTPAELAEAKANIDAEAKKEWIEFTPNEYRSMVGAEVEHT